MIVAQVPLSSDSIAVGNFKGDVTVALMVSDVRIEHEEVTLKFVQPNGSRHDITAG